MQIDFDLPIRKALTQMVQGCADHFRQRLPFTLEGDAAGFEAGHFQEVVDQALHSLGLAGDGLEHGRAIVLR